MRIEHLALYTLCPGPMRDFYRTYFGAKEGAPYHNPKTGLLTWFLTFPDGGCRLELMTRPGIETPAAAQFRAGYTHLCFSLGSREAVDTLTARLASAGFAVKSGPRVTGDGYYESCVLDPDGNEVELVG